MQLRLAGESTEIDLDALQGLWSRDHRVDHGVAPGRRAVCGARRFPPWRPGHVRALAGSGDPRRCRFRRQVIHLTSKLPNSFNLSRMARALVWLVLEFGWMEVRPVN